MLLHEYIKLFIFQTVLLVSQSVLLGYLTETIGNAQDPYLLGAGK